MKFEEWLSQQDGIIEVDCGCVTTEAFYHWMRVAYEAGNSLEIPDGYVMVPKEPTEEMLAAVKTLTLPTPACTYADHSYPAYTKQQVLTMLEALGVTVVEEDNHG